MNERIKELVVESSNGQFHKGKFYPHIGSRTAKDWEKFAELIVRECADIAEKWYSDYPSDDRLLSDAVKQHFGVE